MTQRTDLARGRDIVARWCVLAEQRLEYLTELFETGRWRRYHSEEAFLENIREAKAAVETWHDLLTREATLGNSPIDTSWLGRSGVIAPPLSQRIEFRSVEPQPAEIPAPPHFAAVANGAEPGLADEAIMADEAPVVPEDEALERTMALALDIAAMQERYPLLRNAL